MYISSKLCNDVKLAYMYSDYLHRNWRKLSDTQKDNLLKQIKALTNVTFRVEHYESKMDKL